MIAGHYPDVDVDKKKKPKDPSWKGCCKMMKAPTKFQQFLEGFPELVDKGKITK